MVSFIAETNNDMHPQWKECLYDDFDWLAHEELSMSKMPMIAERVRMAVDDDDNEPITEAYQSSIWAVCTAYLDYKHGTHELSRDELEYTRSRGGVIGMKHCGHEFVIVTIRSILEHYDYGFSLFLNGCPVPAA